jgi:hypothetical protein
VASLIPTWWHDHSNSTWRPRSQPVACKARHLSASATASGRPGNHLGLHLLDAPATDVAASRAQPWPRASAERAAGSRPVGAPVHDVVRTRGQQGGGARDAATALLRAARPAPGTRGAATTDARPVVRTRPSSAQERSDRHVATAIPDGGMRAPHRTAFMDAVRAAPSLAHRTRLHPWTFHDR